MERLQGDIASPRAAGVSSKKSSMTKGPLLGTTIKYKKYDEHGASDIGVQRAPSELLLDLARPPNSVADGKSRARPLIVERLDMRENTTQVESAVPEDEPLFQPFPPEIRFHNYKAFERYEALVYLRNNDKVVRRVRALPIESNHFSVELGIPKPISKRQVAPQHAEDGSSKVACGMEVCYKVVFQPDSTADFQGELHFVTERERFMLPIKATGARGALDIADSMSFADCPAKSVATKTFTVQNVGQRTAVFQLHAPPHFGITPSQGTLVVGGSMQMALSFHPPGAELYQGLLEVAYDTGECTVTRLSGRGHEVDIGLSTRALDFAPTFLHKTSTKTFRLQNRSAIKAPFSFKALPSAEAEAVARARALADLAAQEARERELLIRDDVSDGADSAGSDSEDEDRVLGSAHLALAKKFRALRAAAAADSGGFRSDIFAVSPAEGEIWPHGEVEVSVTFFPADPLQYQATVYCDVAGRAERIPVDFRGLGKGPRVLFTYESLDVGDVFVNSVRMYEVALCNKGDIDATFHLVPPTSAVAQRFAFQPQSGTLRVGESRNVQVRFCCEVMGAFSERFAWRIDGCLQDLTLEIKGSVVGPTFELDVRDLDFGHVSFGFPYTKSVLFHNTSDIPINFRLRIPQADPSGAAFEIEPEAGSIPSRQKQSFLVKITPQAARAFKEKLVVDLVGVRDGALEVPISAACSVPQVSLASHQLDFGTCFLRFPYEKTLEIFNESPLPARFSALPQPEQSQTLATYSLDPPSGVVAPMSAQTVTLTLSTERLGVCHVPAALKIDGREQPFTVTVAANGIGPKLKFEKPAVIGRRASAMHPGRKSARKSLAEVAKLIRSKEGPLIEKPTALEKSQSRRSSAATRKSAESLNDSARTSEIYPVEKVWSPCIDFGKVEVLKEVRKAILVVNESLIPANFKAFVGAKESPFAVDRREGVIEAGATLELHVTALLEDSLRFKDTLNVMVSDGGDYTIPLTATGTGSLILCEELDGGLLHFGPQFTARSFSREIILFNAGKRPQTVNWSAENRGEKEEEGDQKGQKRLSRVAASPLGESSRANTLSLGSIDESAEKGKESGGSPKPSSPVLKRTLSGRSGAENVAQKEPASVFKISPEQATIVPGGSCTFTLTGLATTPSAVKEMVVCKATLGKISAQLYSISLEADVTVPLLQFSSEKMTWAQSWDPAHENLTEETQPLTVKNVSKLPLSFTLRCQQPFSLDRLFLSLEPDEESTVYVSFDPGFATGRLTSTAKGRLTILYSDNPQRDSIELVGEVNFPNLKMEPARIDFGSVLNDTSRRTQVTLANVSALPVRYSWAFLEGDADDIHVSSGSGSVAQRSLGGGTGTPKRGAKLPANRIFDILPIKGCLMPGETETVEVSYYAHPNYRCKCVAVCEVEGGPDYELVLEAESSLIKYTLDRTSIDFGAQPFGRAIDREFTLHNSGRVPVDFKLDLSGVNKGSHLHVGPVKGHVAAGERQRFLVRFVPPVPDKFVERFTVEVAHFEPHEFVIYGEGIYPSVYLSLPRVRSERYETLKEEARRKLERAGPPRSIMPSPAGSHGAAGFGSFPRESHASRMRPDSLASRSKRSSATSARTGSGSKRNAAEKSVLSDADGAALAAEALLLDPTPVEARPRVSSGPESMDSVERPAEGTPRGTSPGHIIGIPTSIRPKLNGTSEYDGGKTRRSGPRSEKSFTTRLKNGPGSVFGGRHMLHEVYVPPEEEVEAEADRLALVEFLRAEQARAEGTKLGGKQFAFNLQMTKDPLDGPLSSNEAAANGVTRPLSTNGGGLRTPDASTPGGENRVRAALSKTPSRRVPPDAQPEGDPTGARAVVSTYVCDFGNVVKGAVRKKTIRVHNPNPTLASFALLNKSALLALGFVVEPESVPKLAEGEGADVTLTLQTARSPVGPIEVRAVIEIKGGPQVAVLLRADVMVPEVQLSADVVDFGAVQTGRCRVMSVQLWNPNGVPAEWAVKRHPDAAHSKDWGYFACEPATGTLQPGERINMEVKFTPGPDQEKYGIKFPIKVNANPRQPMVTCRAIGFDLRVVANPGFLDLGAILPGAPQAGERRFTLQNPSAVPIEVFSLDLDRQYLEEEEALKAAAGFEGLEVLTLPPREPGAPFWSPELLAAGSKVAEEKGDQIGDGNLWAVLSGPAVSCAAQTELLAGKYGVPVINVDTTILEWQVRRRERNEDGIKAEVEAEGVVMEAVEPLTEDQMGEALVERLSNEDCAKGLIIDGLSSQFVSSSKVAKLVLQSLGLRQEATSAAPVDTETGAPGESDAGTEAGVKWVGEKLVTVLLLRDSVEEAAAAAAAAQAADLEVAEAMKRAEEAASPKGGKARPPSSQGKKGKAAKSETKSASRRTSAVQPPPEAAAPKPKTPREELLEALGGATSENHVAVCEVDVAGRGEEELCGDLCALLPDVRSPEERAKEVPPPKEFQLVRQPPARVYRTMVPQFALLTVEQSAARTASPEPPESESSRTGEEELARSLSEGAVPSRGPSPSSGGENYVERTRWVIPPNGSVELLVRFQSDEVGRFDAVLGFEVLGAGAGSAASVACRAVCARPQISSDPRNVFYRKAKTRPLTAQLRKQFVITAGRFEFGPLLAGKNREGYQLGKHPENRERFRISNNGLFDCRVTFAFKNSGAVSGRSTPETSGFTPDESGFVGRGASKSVDPSSKDLKRIASAKTAVKGKKEVTPLKEVKENAPVEFTEEVFVVEPSVLQLKVDETQEIVVYAFPKEVGVVETTLVCTVEDNPEPVEFKLACNGEKPNVEIDGSKPEFQRLLVGSDDTRQLTVKNTCLLPVKWRLVGTEQLPEEFTVEPREGLLEPTAVSTTIAVRFRAAKSAAFQHDIKLQVFDAQELLGVVQEFPVSITAEAYSIEADVRFPSGPDVFPPNGGLDFGVVKVADDGLRTMTVRNLGKYPIGFCFNIRNAVLKELLSVTPLEGTIPPAGAGAPALGGEKQGKNKGGGTPEPDGQVIEVRFNKDKTLRREVNIRSSKDIELAIVEPLNGKRQQTIPVRVNVRAVYSKYTLVPGHGLNFGPTVYKTVAKPRTFEIANDGEFPFSFKLSPFSKRAGTPPTGTEAEATQPAAAPAKGDGKKGAGKSAPSPVPAAAPAGALDVGCFSLTPAAATVAPGTSQTVTVVFKAGQVAGTFRETVSVEVSDRDGADYPAGGVPYELGGEACVPGIAAEDFEGIFEEHLVVPALEPLLSTGKPIPGGVFAVRERVYSFGAVIASVGEAAEPGVTSEVKPNPAGARPASREKTKGAPASSVSAPSPVPATPAPNADGGQKGVKANLRLTNANKVPCTILLSVKPKGAGDSGVPFPMDVQPQRLEIPPHESRYVTASFCPSAIQSFSGILEAVVENGSDAKTRAFTCELRGEGALPHIRAELGVPADSASGNHAGGTGTPALRFSKLLLGRSLTLPLTLRNDGVLPASARLEAPVPESGFAVTDADGVPFRSGSSVTLEPGQRADLRVTFNPLEIKDYAQEVTMVVRHNHFDDQRIQLLGQGYMEDVTLEGLPDGDPSKIRFEDGPIGAPRTLAFVMKNRVDKHWRFAWPAVPFLKFSPAVGHLHAGAEKDVVVTFAPTETVSYTDKDLLLQLSAIKYQDESGPPPDWDDRMAVVRMVPEDQVPSPAEAADRPESGGKSKKAAAGKEKAAGGKAADAKKRPGSGKGPSAEATLEPGPVLAPAAQKPEGDGENSAATGPRLVQVIEVDPEPGHTLVAGGVKTLPVKLTAVADGARYACDVSAVQFKGTVMFQSRSFGFDVRNTSAVRMEYSWAVLKSDGSADSSQLFAINPEEGTVPAGETAHFAVRFSPVEVVDCNRMLVCNVVNLDPGSAPLSIPVDGKVIRPWCHFEFPEGTGTVAERRAVTPQDGEAKAEVGIGSETIRVLEFLSLGTRVKNTKRFHVLNPTSIAYEFVWEQQAVGRGFRVSEEGDELPRSAFACATRKGVIAGGKRFEMAFEYTPETQEPQESAWVFRIPERNISVPFELVGKVVEPRVSLDRASVNFGKVLVGGRGREMVTLVNEEHLPFPFSFEQLAPDGTGHPDRQAHPLVQFEPSAGTLAPDSRLPVKVTYAPAEEKALNMNVVCVVKRKAVKLTLNVKGEGYAVHDQLLMAGPEGSGPIEMVPVGSGGPNFIDYGQVLMNERSVRELTLVNSGSLDYTFLWRAGDCPSVQITPPSGTVRRGDRVSCEVAFQPTASDSTLASYEVTCAVTNGHRYRLLLSGSGHNPKVRFGFRTYDFGPCFLAGPGIAPRLTVLTITNGDVQDISLDLLFENTPDLEVFANPAVLCPGDSQDVRILFHPTAAVVYREVLRFQINGLSVIPVVINGEGTPLKIELADPKQSNISFGSIRLGQQATRMVKLLNRSKLPLTLSFEPSAAALAGLGVSCAPPKGVYLRPRDAAAFELQYKPGARHQLFTENLSVEVAGVNKTLLTMTGACLGVEVKLASDNVPFGSVVLGARLVKRVQLENTGDVGTRFVWETSRLGQNFSIDPVEGFLAPGQDCKVEVAFHPTRLSADARADGVECRVEGFGVLRMALTGTCVAAAAQDAPVAFVSPARSAQTKRVKVTNNSSEDWHIRPAIQNEYWTGGEVLEVLAGRDADYALTYRPMTMTKDGGPLHEGSVFFPRPDGTALLVKLTGQANPPAAAGESSFEVKAKTGFKAAVMVSNWLNKSQRFRAVLEVEKGDRSVTLTGPDLIDVPGLASREFKLRFYSYKAGSICAKATFVNEDTGEFLYHDLRFEVAPPGVVERFTLECPVRQQAVQLVRIQNPLDVPVVITGKCVTGDGKPVPQVAVPASTELKPKAETAIEVLYKPLLAESATCQLVMQSEQLGAYVYDLNLKSSPALPENPLSFSAPLGGRQTQLFRFRHYLPAKATFACSLENGTATGFEVTSATVSAAAAAGPDGMEVEVEVAFEPVMVGDQIRDCLLVRSPEAGDYVCTVTGRALPPAPQGPFTVKEKGSGIPFKNIFSKPVPFTYVVDNPAFVVSKGETIPAKKGVSLSVTFKAQPDTARNGKLLVTCAETSTPWVFYLQGA